eukprot:gene1767-3422_t
MQKHFAARIRPPLVLLSFCSSTNIRATTSAAATEEKGIIDSMLDITSDENQKWMIQYNGLKKYGNTHERNCNLPIKFRTILEDGSTSNLGTWLQTQRCLFRKGILKDNRRILLQELVNAGQLEWNKKSCDNVSWMENYNALVMWTKQNDFNSHLTHDTKVTLPDGKKFSLGKWLKLQRRYIRQGTLRSDRKALLQGLVDEGRLSRQSVECKDDPVNDLSWNLQYEALLKYGEEHNGNCNIPRSEKVILSDGSTASLGHWLCSQREFNRKGTLRPERKVLLQRLVDEGKLAWSFDVGEFNTDDASWDAKYAALVEYGKANGGDCNVVVTKYETSDNNEISQQLGVWLYKQRHLRKKNELREDRKARLQQLVDEGKLNWAIIVPWEVRYNSLLSYAKEHGGKCEIPFYHTGPFEHGYDEFMGLWFSRQKIAFRKGTLLPERERKLQLLVDQDMMTWKNKYEGSRT